MADQQQPPPAPPPAGRGAAGDDSDEEWARMGLGLGDLGDQRAGDGAGVGGGANHDRPVAADGGNGGGRDLVFDRYGNLRWPGRVPPRPGQAVMAPPVGPANREALDERLPGQDQGQGQGEEQGRDDQNQNQNQNQNEDQEQEQNQAPEQAVPPPEPQQPVPVDGPSDDDGDDGGGINADDNAGNNDGNENADGGGVRNRNGNENADGGGGGNRVGNRHGNGEGGDGEHDDADQINANANADDADANADNDNADNANADNDNADNDNPDANAHVLEGGVVGTVTDSSGNRLRVSTECELYIVIEMKETLTDISPGNPATREGTAISIGFDKASRLESVFGHYLEFLNRQPLDPPPPSERDTWRDRNVVTITQIEFVHSDILRPADTAEAASIMKADRIQCQRRTDRERSEALAEIKYQRQQDRIYFRQMAALLPADPREGGASSPAPCDVVFYCTGRLVEDGRKQEVLMPKVRAHSVMCSKRSKYLARMIAGAREEALQYERNQIRRRERDVSDAGGRAPVVAGEDGAEGAGESAGDGGGHRNEGLGIVARSPRVASRRDANQGVNYGKDDQKEDDEDDDEGVRGLPYPANAAGAAPDADANAIGVAANEDEIMDAVEGVIAPENIYQGIFEGVNGIIPAESIDVDMADRPTCAGAGDGAGAVAPFVSTSREDDPAKFWIPLDHPPEAVRLLLEFVYTNRVVCLGLHAHKMGSAPPPPDGPTKITVRRPMVGSFEDSDFPNGGNPSLSLSVALAGIQLAEEAQLPRLSLMCEIAASKLVSSRTVLDALALCQLQSQRTGNKLSILRKACMLNHVLKGKGNVLDDLTFMPSFMKGLKERSNETVPSLLTGTMEAIKATLGEHPKPGETDRYLMGAQSHHHHRRRHGQHRRRQQAAQIAEDQMEKCDEDDKRDKDDRKEERSKRRRERLKRSQGEASLTLNSLEEFILTGECYSRRPSSNASPHKRTKTTRQRSHSGGRR